MINKTEILADYDSLLRIIAAEEQAVAELKASGHDWSMCPDLDAMHSQLQRDWTALELKYQAILDKLHIDAGGNDENNAVDFLVFAGEVLRLL